MARECGKCVLCCICTAVPELGKKERIKCCHCDETGCSIYGNRPESCKGFFCAWMKGEMSDEMSPYRTHFLVERLPNVDSVLVLVEPGHELSWKNDRVEREFREEYVEKGIAVVTIDKFALIPKGRTVKSVISDLQEAIRTIYGVKH